MTDELLSSWPVRHAAYYGVTASFFAQWLMLGTRNLSTLDYDTDAIRNDLEEHGIEPVIPPKSGLRRSTRRLDLRSTKARVLRPTERPWCRLS